MASPFPRPAKRDEPVTDRLYVWLQSRPALLALGLVRATLPELIVRKFVGARYSCAVAETAPYLVLALSHRRIHLYANATPLAGVASA